MTEYVQSVLREAEIRQEEANDPFTTVYFGGGTPSLLPAETMLQLIQGLKQRLNLKEVTEWTVEANPGTLTPAWASLCRDNGVNRISLGMQAAQPGILQLLGRIHDAQAVAESVHIVRKAGFQNLNLDLMFGIPTQTQRDWRETLEAALSLEPDHISAYGLIPERGTPLWNDLEAEIIKLPEPEEEREMYENLLCTLSACGFIQYEISNFAKPGYECRHNTGYWDQTAYMGLGLSAASLVYREAGPEGMKYLRKTNASELEGYLDGIRSGSPGLSESEWISPEGARFETMMLGLRMNRGVAEDTFSLLHGVSLEKCYGDRLRLLQRRGLTVKEANAWKMTRLGMDLQNMALVELMD